MRRKERYMINVKGRLMDLGVPKIMGILNVTPDSFFQGSRTLTIEDIRKRVEALVNDGADIIDIGGCSTRPGFFPPSVEEEWERVDRGCEAVRYLSEEIPLSVDTFRAEIADRAIRKWGADIINDISGGSDPLMWKLMAESGVVYVLTHNRLPEDLHYNDVTAEVITELSKKINELHRLGVNDVIVDPGFGFSKRTEDNFKLFNELNEIGRMGYPVLVGISRKSMIYKSLGISPEESLVGTVALDAIALEKGADILRVHDVKEARDTVRLYNKLNR